MSESSPNSLTQDAKKDSSAARLFKSRFQNVIGACSDGVQLRLSPAGRLSLLKKESEWEPACELCFLRWDRASLAKAELDDSGHARLCLECMQRVERKRKRLRKRKRRRKLQAEQRRQHQEQNALPLATTTDNSAAGATGEVDTPICAENELANHQKKKRQLDEDDQCNQKRPRHDTVAPVSSAVQLWLQRLADAEPFVEKRPGVKMLQHYGSAFKVIDGQRLVFKEWRAGQESVDRPACEECYTLENIATVATISRDREWPTVCARHGEGKNQTTTAPPERATTAREKTQQGSGRTGKRKYKCTECDSCFEGASSLTVHKRVHTGEKPYQCTECDKCFARAGSLTEHKRVHTGEKPYQCTECDKRFARAGRLTEHKRVHTGEKPYQCTECDSRFANAGKLKVHKRVHTGEKPYQCTECDRRFAEAGKLTMHKRVHTGEKPYQCTECDSRFAHISSLTVHKRVHTGEKPYQCTECNSRFSEAGNLERHKRVHTGEKPYQCTECDSCFAHNCSLTVHKRVHTGEKPYQCTECDSRFVEAGNLRQHERRHDESKKWQHTCVFASFSTAKYDATNGLVQCTTRCKTEQLLDDHVQRCHTSEGIAKRFKSEQQLAEFLVAKGWAFDRDFANAIFYKHCDKQLTPKLTGTVSSRPDFHLLEFQSLPTDRKCLLLLCNDEFAHRRYRCELGRMLKISTALAANPNFRDLPIIYVRFNPHYFLVDGVLHDPPLQSRFERLQRLLTDLQGGRVPEVAGRPGLSLIYLYYDRQTPAAGAQPWQRLAGGLYDATEDTGDGNSEVALALRDCVVLVE